jgi:hypothetical protein
MGALKQAWIIEQEANQADQDVWHMEPKRLARNAGLVKKNKGFWAIATKIATKCRDRLRNWDLGHYPDIRIGESRLDKPLQK